MIGSTLHGALSGNTSAGTRVRPMALGQNPTLPAIVYQVVSRATEPAHDGGGTHEPRVQLSCWGVTYDAAHTLADEVEAILDGARVDGVRFLAAGRLDDEDEATREGDQLGRCRVIADYMAMHARAPAPAPPSASHLRLGAPGDYVSVPDSPPLSITGDISIRVRLALDDWTSPGEEQWLFTKWRTPTDERCYNLAVIPSGALKLDWSVDGTNPNAGSAFSTDLLAFADGSVHWVWGTMQPDDGAGARHIKFYTSNDATNNADAVATWVPLGAMVTAPATSIFDGANDVNIGGFDAGVRAPVGDIYAVQLRAGFDGAGPVVASPKFQTVLPYTDAQGNVWTPHGAAALV